MRVIFTERAFVSILAETAEKVQTETGGIFLGFRDGDVWYVIESIDPGPKSVFQVAYFEYDQKYVSHLASKVARLYNKPLELLGLWHRHPGSFDRFSGTDDKTNGKYASLNKAGAISALVNIDPEFRLTVFYVSKPFSYERVQYSVGDDLVPIEYRQLCDSKRLLDYLSAKTDSIWGKSKPKKPRYKYDLILGDILKNISSLDITEQVENEKIDNLTEENIVYLLEQIETDVNCFGDCYLECQLILQDKSIRLSVQNDQRYVMEFYVDSIKSQCIFKFKDRFYLYVPNMFTTILEDIISAMKQNRLFFNVNKEFIVCSLQKTKRN